MGDLVDDARRNLAERGIDLVLDAAERTTDDLAVFGGRLRRGSDTAFRIVVGRDVSPSAAVAHADERPTLVVTSSVSPRRADAFRRHDVHYIDEAGNASLTFGDVFIDVRGRRGETSTAARQRPQNLLSAARAQVIFAVLTWPELFEGTQRDIAWTAGVSVGQANNTLGLLLDEGWLSGHETRARLLDTWAVGYLNGLARKLTLASFAGSLTSPIISRHLVLVSGERAAPELLKPSSQVLYVRDLDPHLPVDNRWRVDGPVNTTVRRLFWHEPRETQSSEVGTAPWTLVYADLLAARDPRARDAAQTWRRQHER